MDEITAIIKGVRVTLCANGDCLLWADHKDQSPDPDVSIRLADLEHVIDLSLYLRGTIEEE